MAKNSKRKDRKRETKKRSRKAASQASAPQPRTRDAQVKKLGKAFYAAYHAGRTEEALDYALRAHKLIPHNANPLSDIATCYITLQDYAKAAEYAELALARNPQHINSLDAAAHSYGLLNNREKAAQSGRKALELRDAQYTAQAKQTPIDPATFAPLPPPPSAETKSKNIIAMSLYGALPKYCEMAIANAEYAPTVYPHWTLRVYVDGSVPQHVVQRLLALKAQVIRVAPAHEQMVGTFWRFLALDDSYLHRVAFRDADSLVTEAEAAAVQEWIDSGKHFHAMRDSCTHTELLLAGMWGAVTGALTAQHSIQQQITAYLEQYNADKGFHFADQFFLRECLWTTVRQSLIQHDSLFGFLNAQPFPITTRKEGLDVGASPTTSFFEFTHSAADGTVVQWQFTDSEGNALCEYPATIHNGKAKVPIPLHIAKSMERKELHVKVLG